ncbi:MAG TPA: ABC transporter permease [Gemmatimonadaceae bacterium]|nr:ABC transporter permease [Gemmatimonadaceae bacterium]
MWTDIRLALRSFRRAPAFAAAAVLTLAIGIGATSTIFTLVNAVLLESLPFRDPDHLLFVRGEMRREGPGPTEYPISFLDAQSLAQDRATFEYFVPLSGARPYTLAANGEVEHVTGEMVGDGFFSALGVPMAVGRAFDLTEGIPPGARVAVLSHALWSRRFGAERGVIGKIVTLNDASYEVIGVAAPGFNGASDEAQLWIPLALAGELYGPHYIEMREFRWLSGVARVRPPLTAERANRSLAAASARLEAEFPKENEKLTFVGETLADAYFGEQRRPLWSMMAAAAFVLLIACTNVANLLLARAASKRQEIAVRLALGAGRARLVRQSLAESLTLMALGTVLGLAIAGAGARLIVASGAIALPSFQNVGVSPLVVLVTGSIALACTLLFGVAPALMSTRVNPRERIGDGGKGASAGRGRLVFQRGLIVAEVAVAVALLTGAGLMRKGFEGFVSTDLGFRRDSVLSLRLDLTSDRFKENEAVWSVLRRLTEESRALPGAVSVAAEGPGLPTGGWYQAHLVRVDGSQDPSDQLAGRRHHVTPGYFETLGVRLLAGRDFASTDVANAPRALIVSERFARLGWPGESPLGKRLRSLGPTPVEFAVVGVVADVDHGGLQTDDSEQADIYLSAFQSPPRSPSLVTLYVRHRGDARALLDPLRAVMKRIDPFVPFYDIRSLQERLDEQTATGRFLVRLMATFAFIGLVLAAIGVYGVIAYAVTQRTREIGIRVALGATRSRVTADVIGWGLRPVLVGLVLGVAAVAMLYRFVRVLLYGVQPLDPATLAITIVALVLVALVASWHPARRAARIDPAAALRSE